MAVSRPKLIAGFSYAFACCDIPHRKNCIGHWYLSCGWVGKAKLVQALATGWAIRVSNPGGGEIFPTGPDQSWAHTASYTIGTGSLPRGKSGRGVMTTYPI
jgi:hypothetical protein